MVLCESLSQSQSQSLTAVAVSLQILGQQSQAHDAVLSIMKGAMTLINNEETITADKLMPAIKSVSLGTRQAALVFSLSLFACSE